VHNEEERSLVRRYVEAFNTKNAALLAEIVAPNYILHLPPAPQPLVGLDAAIQVLEAFATGFPDLRFTANDIVVEGERVVLHWVLEGTHRGVFQGIPATGKKISIEGMSLHRFAGDRIAETHIVADNLAMLQQLGVVQTRA
jgi:steroid delta-isomerase-like uncharacterized protein